MLLALDQISWSDLGYWNIVRQFWTSFGALEALAALRSLCSIVSAAWSFRSIVCHGAARWPSQESMTASSRKLNSLKMTLWLLENRSLSLKCSKSFRATQVSPAARRSYCSLPGMYQTSPVPQMKTFKTFYVELIVSALNWELQTMGKNASYWSVA